MSNQDLDKKRQIRLWFAHDCVQCYYHIWFGGYSRSFIHFIYLFINLEDSDLSHRNTWGLGRVYTTVTKVSVPQMIQCNIHFCLMQLEEILLQPFQPVVHPWTRTGIIIINEMQKALPIDAEMKMTKPQWKIRLSEDHQCWKLHMVMLYPYALLMEFRLFSVQFMRHVMSVAFMTDANILEPLYKGHPWWRKKGGLWWGVK